MSFKCKIFKWKLNFLFVAPDTKKGKEVPARSRSPAKLRSPIKVKNPHQHQDVPPMSRSPTSKSKKIFQDPKVPPYLKCHIYYILITAWDFLTLLVLYGNWCNIHTIEMWKLAIRYKKAVTLSWIRFCVAYEGWKPRLQDKNKCYIWNLTVEIWMVTCEIWHMKFEIRNLKLLA